MAYTFAEIYGLASTAYRAFQDNAKVRYPIAYKHTSKICPGNQDVNDEDDYVSDDLLSGKRPLDSLLGRILTEKSRAHPKSSYDSVTANDWSRLFYSVSCE